MQITHLRRLKGLLLLLFLFISCDKEYISPPPAEEPRLHSLVPTEDPLLMGMLETLTGVPVAGRQHTTAFGAVHLDKALRVEDPSGQSRYTLLLEQTRPLMWKNLVLQEHGGQVSGYLIEYWPDLPWARRQAVGIDMQDYTGVIGFKSLGGTPLAASWMHDGLSVYSKYYTLNARVMCEEAGTGGGDSGTWGDFGDVADAGTGESTGTTDGGGEACILSTSETTGMLIADCPDIGIIGFSNRLQCDDLGDSGSSGGDGTDAETGIGIIEPTLLDPLYIEAEAFERKIDSTELDDCIKEVLGDFLDIPTSVGWVVRKFAGEEPGYNWILMDSVMQAGRIGVTGPQYDWANKEVTSVLNSAYYDSATDLAVLKTILHESTHAYILSYFRLDPMSANKTYAQLIEDIVNHKYKNQQIAQHHQIVRSFITDIGVALEAYGKSKGYPMQSQFYNDLAWGGLHNTTYFFALPVEDKVRIANVVSIEQTGQDISDTPKTQRGTKLNCQ